VAGDCGGVSEHGTFRDGSVKEPERSTAVLARSGPSGVCRTIWNIPEKGRRCSVKSDSLIVLGAWESRAHGEAASAAKTDKERAEVWKATTSDKAVAGELKAFAAAMEKRFGEDGVRAMVRAAGGAYWLLDEIALAQRYKKRVAAEEFQNWTLKVKDDNTARLTCDDGNGNIVFSKRIPFTDFPLPEISLYFCNSTILLPSEVRGRSRGSGNRALARLLNSDGV